MELHCEISRPRMRVLKHGFRTTNYFVVRKSLSAVDITSLSRANSMELHFEVSRGRLCALKHGFRIPNFFVVRKSLSAVDLTTPSRAA
jgi:hypothetical protein